MEFILHILQNGESVLCLVGNKDSFVRLIGTANHKVLRNVLMRNGI